MRGDNDDSTQMHEDEIEEIIQDRISYMHREFNELVGSFHMSFDTIISGAFSPIKSLKTYGFADVPKPHLICSFEAIGWPDPFPSSTPTYSGKYHEPVIFAERVDKELIQTKNQNKALAAESDFIYEARNINPKKVLAIRKEIEEAKKASGGRDEHEDGSALDR